MAVRTGAGTGVIVSLVVFVLTTVFLLVLSIVFYAGKTNETQARADAEATLATYVNPRQRSDDAFKRIEAEAKKDRHSVSEYLNSQFQQLMGYTSGDPAMTMDGLKAQMSRFGVGENDSIRSAMQSMHRDLQARQTEINGLREQVTELSDQLAKRDASIEQLKAAHQEEVNTVEQQIAGYRDAANEYRTRLNEAIDELRAAKDSLRNTYEGRITMLEDENNALARQRRTLTERINELEVRLNRDRLKPQSGDTLVDGWIIDAPGSGDEVYINRGKKNRIVLGMTFEVYADGAQLRPHPVTGEMPRGKASLQVTKVADTTATCKITRSVPGQPVVRNDVIANAVYDPDYEFKFLVHGKFDIDADGRPTEAEAEYLRSLVVEWGGTVVTGTELPGDLDFLILGIEPPVPIEPAPDAPVAVINDFIRKRETVMLYRELFEQASEAQIPVLNANRFFILIGYTDR